MQGISKRIILDTDKGYYYTGRCEIETEKNNDVTAEIVISCKCERIKSAWILQMSLGSGMRSASSMALSGTPQTSRSAPALAGRRLHWTVGCINETLRIVSNAEMKVRYRNSTYTIYTGENIMYDIVLYKGVNDLYFQGTGKVTLIHRGGML